MLAMWVRNRVGKQHAGWLAIGRASRDALASAVVIIIVAV